MTSTTLRRLAAVSAGFALAVSGLGTSPASADPSPAGGSAAGWITGKLVNGQLFPEGFNNGFNIDAGLAELAMGNTAAVGQIRDALAGSINDYIAFEPDDPGSTYAGPTAKALSFVVRSGGDPTSFGGVNLVSRLEATVSSAPATAGRIADISTFGDFANTIGQSFATQGLAAVNSPKAASVRAFLLKQQCPDGEFRLAFSDPADPQQGCITNPAAPTGPDVTAYAVLGLQDQYADPMVKAAVDKAVAWLRSIQAADGSFTDEDSKPNSNSTGLAGAALGQSCAVDAATRAAAWIRGVQVPPGQTGPLAGDVGAVAFGPAELAAAQSAGITDLQQWKVSTAQATPTLAWDPAAPATVQVKPPSKFVKGGSHVRVSITGVAKGERVCVSDSTGGSAALTGTGAALSYEVTTARKGGDVTVTATTGPGKATGTVKVLGKARLKPKLAKTVHRGHRAAVTVKKLGAKEKVRLYVDGRLVARGKANKKGVFKGGFAAKLKVGKHKLKVVGQFKNRTGTAAFRVVG
ncbi:MAG TPA: hypothetical protein VFV89_00020 [Nocardioides sp.]|uniref:hypothetical protein n=1 Tax=Nocardioides sp. TaxID=35761 RepID=UPI002E3088FC|nr:hypothetical protein [Nocardioides sp.]HEX5086161.1 hypothetical protein [Nocardioides sp.]